MNIDCGKHAETARHIWSLELYPRSGGVLLLYPFKIHRWPSTSDRDHRFGICVHAGPFGYVAFHGVER